MAAASPSSELLKASRRAGAAGESGKAGGGGAVAVFSPTLMTHLRTVSPLRASLALLFRSS